MWHTKRKGGMAIIDFLKGKKARELPLPPPPSPRGNSIVQLSNPPIPAFRGDFEPIRAQAQSPALPDFSDEGDSALEGFPPATLAPAQEKEVTVFDKTLTQGAGDYFSKEEPKEVIRMMPHPAFIAVEDYKRIVNDTNSIRAHVMNAESFAKKLSELKADEERALERWRMHLEDVEKKLAYVDQLIEKAEKV